MSTNPFFGTWQLVSAETRTASGEVSYPFGRNARGYLIYGQDGYMAVAIMGADRIKFTTADVRGGTSEEKLTAFDTYLSYCGTYKVRGDKVVHQIELSLFPNWSGTEQERFFELTGDQLILRTAPMALEGTQRTAQLIWHRASA